MSLWPFTKNRGRSRRQTQGIERYAFSGADIRQDVVGKYGPQGDLLDIYTSIDTCLVHKWHHYLPLYERYFGPWRRPASRPLRFLEIGVFEGGSLAMWRRYFGPDAVIFGIDINPDCKVFDGQAGSVRIGSQADPDFLRSVVREMGGVDVVLDDGSHVMAHVKAALQVLFPLLSEGGTYMIEDLHTAYWKSYGGGLGRSGNFFDVVRDAIDDMHQWYHDGGVANPELAMQVSGLHVHDSIVVLDKAQVFAPTHSQVGRRTTGKDAG